MRKILFFTDFQAIYKYYLTRYSIEAVKVAELPLAAVARLAKKNGAERVGSDATTALVAKAEDYLACLVKESNKLAIHAGRKTIKEEDVALAAKSV